MAKWIEGIARRLGFEKTGARRDFSAAALTRLTGGWNSVNTSANVDLYRGLDTLRARSRDLCQNNDYGKRFLGMVGANVVGGTGVILQSRVYDAPGKPDDGANDGIESSWDRWGLRGSCEVTGRMSWRDVQMLVIKTVARDGEALIRKVRGKAAGNGYGYALQVLDIDRLDTKLIRKAEGGQNEIRMGVEINAYGRAVAYWLRPYHPGDQWYTQGVVMSQHQVVPADEIIHVYTAERPEQLRGVPWMHAAMTRLNNLGGYEEAAVIAARVGASKMGFFTSPDGEPPKDGEDEQGVPFTDADPGSFGTLPNGMDFKPFNPDYPHAMYGEFVKACLRGIASGLGVSYHGLANDLEGVNFSSIRSGTLEERDQWMNVQQWFIDSFLEPVFTDWIGAALAFGQITLANGSPLPVAKAAKFSVHTWQARRWQWVDPLRDIEASVTAIQNGLKAPQDIAAELGVDFEDVLIKIKQAQDMVDKIGVVLGKPDPAAIAEKVTPTANATASAAKALEIIASDRVDRGKADREHELRQHDALLAALRSAKDALDRPAPAPVVNVEAPVVNVEARMPDQPAPVVNVEAPIVNLEATVPPATVVMQHPKRARQTIERDAAGEIKQLTLDYEMEN